MTCFKLTSVNIPAATVISNNAFFNCYELRTIGSIPAVSVLGGSAFLGCSKLEMLSLPAITSMSNYAFRNCWLLTELHLEGVTVVPSLGVSVFASTPIGGYSAKAGRYGSVFVPASLYSSFTAANQWNSIASRIVSV